MTIKPIEDKLLIEEFKPEEKTAGGIYIPSTSSRQNQVKYGTVKEVGTGKLFSEPESPVHVGDVVIFDAYAGIPIKCDLVDHLIISFNNIQAVQVD
jgi:chaperonin GroES